MENVFLVSFKLGMYVLVLKSYNDHLTCGCLFVYRNHLVT